MHDSKPLGAAVPRAPDPEGSRPEALPIARSGLDWTWVIIGVVLGTVLVSVLVTIVENEPPRPDVAILIGGLTFLLTGVLIGYRSPGETVAEATVAGGIVGIMSAGVLTLGFGFEIGVGTLVGGWLAILLLTTLGGTMGEILQGTISADPQE